MGEKSVLIEELQRKVDHLKENFSPPGWGSFEEIVIEFTERGLCPDYLSVRYRVSEIKAKAILRALKEEISDREAEKSLTFSARYGCCFKPGDLKKEV